MHAGDHRVVIDDFRIVTVDGKTRWKGRQDKGHQAMAAAFRHAVAGEEKLPTEEMIATMRATIRAAAGGGEFDDPASLRAESDAGARQRAGGPQAGRHKSQDGVHTLNPS